MHPASRARWAFVLLYGALLAWQIDRWCFTPHGIVSSWAHRHDGKFASTGSPTGVTQTFTMGADGLDAIWIRPQTDGRRAAGELIVDLAEVRDEATTRLERVVVPAAALSVGSDARVRFREVRHSRGRIFAITFRHIAAGGGPAIDLAVTREDHLPQARLFTDGREQWGDLVFETGARRATLPYWLPEILRPWPAWVRSWPTVVVVLVLFNVLLMWACARGVDAGARRDRVRAARRGPALVPGRAAVLGVGLLVISGLALSALPSNREHSFDLIDALPEARLETSWPSLHDGIAAQPVVFDNVVRRSIVAMPTSRMAWTLDVPPGALFRSGAAMRPDMWGRNSDGIEMVVSVEHARGRTLMAHLTLFPLGVVEHRKLFPVEVPLHPWTGQRVTLVLESTPERWGNAVNDVPVWVEPRIEWPRRGTAPGSLSVGR